MRDSIEVFVPDRRQVFQSNAAICLLGMLFAAVDRNNVAAGSQACGEFFGESLETAIARRYAACAKDGEAHSVDSQLSCGQRGRELLPGRLDGAQAC